MKHTQQLITRRAFVAGSSAAVAGAIIGNRSVDTDITKVLFVQVQWVLPEAPPAEKK